ncbi:MAG: type I polyketide synthase, partial [Cyclobacteriaceae bacterium]
MTTEDSYTGLEIAVIGMSGRFPQSKNLEELWENLKNGKEMVSFFTDEELLEQGIPQELVSDPNYIKAKGVLADAEYFDAQFFGYTNKEADYMDPQFRVFHECVYNALEDAGYADPKYRGVTGLFAGAGFNPFWIANFLPSFESFSDIFEISSLNAREYLTTRIAYKLDLNGPTMTLQTACSTSLVAVHMACQSLLAGEADMALAGGVSILFPSMDLPRKYGMPYQNGMIISKDGHCKPFDKEANGFMGGDGVGVVVLKRLEDAIEQGDNIYAVIKGSAINNDGSAKAGYSAPGTKGQTNVIKTAMQLADIQPESVSYIETHGSGTKLGDPIEVQALTDAYNREKGNHCGIGSVKSNFGHLDAAAGIAGFIKTVLTVKNSQIPPSINFNDPNPEIDFENSPFYVNDQLQDWEKSNYPRRAGVSSFGIGGTNAHLIVEEAPAIPENENIEKERLILLSAKTKQSLLNSTESLKNYLESNKEINITDLAYTLQVGRKTFDHKRGIVCKNIDELIEQLSPELSERKSVYNSDDKSESIVFVFSGLGGQYLNMGFDLYEKSEVFRDLMDEGFDLVKELHDIDLKAIVYPEVESDEHIKLLNNFDNAQMAIFVFERAIAKLLMSWGVKPSALMGYSFGELTAAHIAGVMSLRDTIRFIAKRGELIMQCPKGSMLSVPVSKEELGELQDGLSLAIDNGDTCVVSGTEEAIETLTRKLQDDRIICMKLNAGRAIHSDMMREVADSLSATISELTLSVPTIPLISNVTGTWVNNTITSADYWISHLSKTVEFAKGIETLLALPGTLLTEIGPGADITSTLQKFISDDANHIAINTIRPSVGKIEDMKYLLMRLQKLWQHGIEIDWTRLYENETPRRLALPGYSFDKHRYWFQDREKKSVSQTKASNNLSDDELIKNTDHSKWYYTPSWRQLPYADSSVKFDAISSWLVFSDDSRLSEKLIKELANQNQEVVVVRKGVSYKQTGANEYVLNPGIEGQFQYLVSDLSDVGVFPEKVLHLWSLSDKDLLAFEDSDYQTVLAEGFNSLTHLARTMYEYGLGENHLDIFAITKEMYSVTGGESLAPVHATILGAVRVLPIEFRNVKCHQVDIDADNADSAHQILQEISGKNDEQVVAFRKHYKWVQTFDPLPAFDNGISIRDIVEENKVYMIAGGLCTRSNLGYIFAKHLSDLAPVKIVMMSRTAYPDRSEWDRIVNEKNDADLSEKITQIRDIEKGFGEVFTYCGDITDYNQLEQTVSKIEEEVGQINGLINVAGIMNDQAMGLIINNDSQLHSKKQFNIKVQGTVNLYKIFSEKEPDFCLMSSSLTSVMGPFSAYCAGNNFIDAFVQSLN